MRLRIFVGGSNEHRVPYEVLRHSILRNASIPVEVRMLGDEEEERRIPGRWRRKAPTSFSFQRFLIPRICGYEGRAVYLDSDQVVLGDVAELATLSFGGTDDPIHASAGRRDETGAKILTTGGWQSAVMVLNCAALDWDVVALCRMLDEKLVRYHDLSALRFMSEREVVGGIPPEWNCLDANHSERNQPAKLIHYTGMRTQPWLRQGHPFGSYWNAAFAHWLMAGDEAKPEWRDLAQRGRQDVVRDALNAGWIRPSLAVAVGAPGVVSDEGFVLPDDRRKQNGGVL